MLPARLVALEEARARFGDRVDRIAPLLQEGDPLADAAAEALSLLPDRERRLSERLAGGKVPVPAPVEALIARSEEVPIWVDLQRLERGGRALLRTGVFGGFVLAFRSLVLGYCSPAGNKPLVMSGRLTERAGRRIAETGRFVQAVCLPGGLRKGQGGFTAAIRVRLMHAQVRRLAAKSPSWDAGWGTPINQWDMAGTLLLFSLIVGDGLRQLGAPFSDAELADLLHLWRYAGFVLGVREELLCASEDEARTLWAMTEATQAMPDANSRALAQALIESPVHQAKDEAERVKAARSVQVGYAISRFLIGERYADALGFPRSPWLIAAPALRAAIASAGAVAKRLPGLDWLMLEAGLGYWRRAMALGLGEDDARFELPERLARR